jgi:hypothetical protein
MVAKLRHHKFTILHAVDHAMLLIDAARPVPLQQTAKPLRFSNPAKWITTRVTDQLINPLSQFFVVASQYR